MSLDKKAAVALDLTQEKTGKLFFFLEVIQCQDMSKKIQKGNYCLADVCRLTALFRLQVSPRLSFI